MAVNALDKQWDDAVDKISDCHAQAVGLLKNGEAKQALDLYEEEFLPTVKSLDEVASSTYPKRFSKIDDWCGWMAELKSRVVELKPLLEKQPAKGGEECAALIARIEDIHGHFFKLHEMTDTRKVSDFIYALRRECLKEKPDAVALRKYQEGLSWAGFTRHVQVHREDYQAALKKWEDVALPILKDATSISSSGRRSLLKAIEPFYMTFGTQME